MTRSPYVDWALAQVSDPRMLADRGIVRRPPNTIHYADTARYILMFGVESSSTPGKLYKVGLDTAQGCWVCECRGGIHHGHCHHLTEYGLPGRRARDEMIEREDSEGFNLAAYQRAEQALLFWTRDCFWRDLTRKQGQLVPWKLIEQDGVTLLSKGLVARLNEKPVTAPSVAPPRTYEPSPIGAPAPKLSAAMLAPPPPIRRFVGRGRA